MKEQNKFFIFFSLLFYEKYATTEAEASVRLQHRRLLRGSYRQDPSTALGAGKTSPILTRSLPASYSMYADNLGFAFREISTSARFEATWHAAFPANCLALRTLPTITTPESMRERSGISLAVLPRASYNTPTPVLMEWSSCPLL